MLLGLVGDYDGRSSGAGKDTVARMLAPVHLVNIAGQEVDVRPFAPHDADSFTPLVTHAAICAFADPMKAWLADVYDWSMPLLWGPSTNRDAPDERYPREQATHEIRALTSLDTGALRNFKCVRCNAHFQTQFGPPPGPCAGYLTPRYALQQLGTDYGRFMWESTWVAYWLRRAKRLLENVRVEKPAEAHTFVASWTLKRCELVVASDVRFRNEVEAIKRAGGKVWYIQRGERKPTTSATNGPTPHVSEVGGIEASMCDRVIDNNGTLADLYERVREALAASR